MTNTPEVINAQEVLSQWYGPDSIVCQTVKIVNAHRAEAKFTVGQNLCGHAGRPPMLDMLQVTNYTDFTTKTSPNDAKQHFIDSIGISVVPGHNLIGLITEALVSAYRPKAEGTYLAGFDFVRFRSFILPGQEINFVGFVAVESRGFSGTFTMLKEKRPFVKNLRVEIGDLLDESVRTKVLAAHWISEFNAQGLGIFGLKNTEETIVPVLMEIGRSSFAKVPILAGNTMVSQLEVISVDKDQLMGSAQVYVDGVLIAEQTDLLLHLVSIEDIKARISQAQGRSIWE